jgi:spore photoproduct lyase
MKHINNTTKKEKNTFNHLTPQYINNNNSYDTMDTTNGGVQIQNELIPEQKNILHHCLDINDFQNKTLQVNNSRIFPIDKIKDGSIITLFNKTPIPENPSDIVCPHFYELKWANGCNFNCAWCYLNGTYRFLSGGKKPRLKNIDTIIDHLDYFLEKVDGNFLLNSGELSDSLLFENDGAPLSRKIIPRILQQNKHKLLILTKSTDIKHLLDLNAQQHVITSFSLNSFKVAKTWEKAPKVSDRIIAAKKLYDSGYKVRVRIDPMVPIENWRKEYTSLIELIFNNFTPERITLGSLRGLQSTINNSKDTSWIKYLNETSNWGKKVDTGHRLAMYSAIINTLKNKYDYNKIALCKETIDIWKRLNLDYKKIQCNCLL